MSHVLYMYLISSQQVRRRLSSLILGGWWCTCTCTSFQPKKSGGGWAHWFWGVGHVPVHVPHFIQQVRRRLSSLILEGWWCTCTCTSFHPNKSGGGWVHWFWGVGGVPVHVPNFVLTSQGEVELTDFGGLVMYLYMYHISSQQVRRRLSSLILGGWWCTCTCTSFQPNKSGGGWVHWFWGVGGVPVHVPHFIPTSLGEVEFTDFGGLVVYLYMYLISSRQVRGRFSSLVLGGWSCTCTCTSFHPNKSGGGWVHWFGGVGRVPVHVPHFIPTSQAEVEFTDLGGLVVYLYMYLISSQQVRRRLSSLILGDWSCTCTCTSFHPDKSGGGSVHWFWGVGRVPVHVPHFSPTSQVEVEFTDFGGLVVYLYMYLISSQQVRRRSSLLILGGWLCTCTCTSFHPNKSGGGWVHWILGVGRVLYMYLISFH